MGRFLRFVLFVSAAVAVLTVPLSASAGHTTDPRTPNMQPLGHIEERASLIYGPTNIHTDISFWKKWAVQGNWNGFNIRDISDPNNPQPVSFTRCDGDQGDISVWKNLVIRSTNSPNTSGTRMCDGAPVPAGYEGVEIFDISNKADPQLITRVSLACGSHTHTTVPDRANQRLIVYSNASSGCNWIDIVEVPLKDPSGSHLLGTEPLEHPCHDMGVILGKAMMAACAGGDGFDAFSLGGARGGSLEDPMHMYHVVVPTVTIGHSATFTWDGELIVFGHEPGGGVAAECEATDDPLKRTFFFYRAATGALAGMWTLPRTQTSTENCTLHNLNVVPVKGRYILVHGSYQSGTSVVDFTNPAAAVELGWSDPPPMVPFDIGGAWSSYWYNDYIYESNINEGLNVFRFTGSQTKHAKRLNHLNPQTQEWSF